MSNRFKKAVVDDVFSSNIGDDLQENLLVLFESAMKSVAPTLICEAKFNLTDFASAKERGCDGFSLVVRRARPGSQGEWIGFFQRETESLNVIGHLE